MDVQRVDHDAAIRPVGGTDDVDRFRQVGEARKARELKIHRQAERLGQIANFA